MRGFDPLGARKRMQRGRTAQRRKEGRKGRKGRDKVAPDGTKEDRAFQRGTTVISNGISLVQGMKEYVAFSLWRPATGREVQGRFLKNHLIIWFRLASGP